MDKKEKCQLIAIAKNTKTTIVFFEDSYTDEKYNEYLNDFKSDSKIIKIIRKEKKNEEILFEKSI